MERRRITATRVLVSSVALCLVLAAATLATTKKPPLKPININTATSEELQQVPGIGPVTAEKILLMRKSYGAFKSFRPASHQRPRQKTPRKNAQIPHRQQSIS